MQRGADTLKTTSPSVRLCPDTYWHCHIGENNNNNKNHAFALLEGWSSFWAESLPRSSFLRTGGETREEALEALGMGAISEE